MAHIKIEKGKLAEDKILRAIEFENLGNPNNDGYQKGLFLWFMNFLIANLKKVK